jgi:hypothetical protein
VRRVPDDLWLLVLVGLEVCRFVGQGVDVRVAAGSQFAIGSSWLACSVDCYPAGPGRSMLRCDRRASQFHQLDRRSGLPIANQPARPDLSPAGSPPPPPRTRSSPTPGRHRLRAPRQATAGAGRATQGKSVGAHRTRCRMGRAACSTCSTCCSVPSQRPQALRGKP